MTPRERLETDAIAPGTLAAWVRAEMLAIEHAKRIATDIGWCHDDLPGLVRAALDHYAVERCQRGTCAHEGCTAVNATVYDSERPWSQLAARAGIRFSVRDGTLYATPRDAITDEWKFFIARNKQAIIAEVGT